MPTHLGLALSSIYFGQIAFQLPGGWLVARFGGWKILVGSILLSSILTIFQPLAAMHNFILFVILRILTGFCQVYTLFPNIFEM